MISQIKVAAIGSAAIIGLPIYPVPTSTYCLQINVRAFYPRPVHNSQFSRGR